MKTPLWDALAASFERHADRVLVDDGVRALTGEALAHEVARAAAALSGCRVVALAADNGSDWAVADLAALACGASLLPLPLFFSPAQRAHALLDAGADTLLRPCRPGETPLPGCLSLTLERLAPTAAARCPASTAKLTYTSGTTGSPKGVCLEQGLLLATANALAEATGGGALTSHLALLPLSTLLENVAGLYRALLVGARCVLPALAEVGLTGSSGLDRQALCAAISRHAPASVISVPQILTELVAATQAGWVPPASLQFVAVGGARVAPALVETARAAALPVYEGYGLSECGSVVCLNTPHADRPGSVGRPLPHVRTHIENGELVIELPAPTGYLGDDASFSRRVASGDLVHADADGFVHVAGRRKHVLITAFGRNVSPEWVESELCADGRIRQCVVLGEGEPALFALAFAPGASDDALAETLAHANAALPDYARVARLIRLDAPLLPGGEFMTENGRPRRGRIAEHWAGAPATGPCQGEQG
ncbi:AMP-binding protein [Crenobacter caeni]|uniref:Long-chain fatty acid--CoA ligase n=1 Tax=Crenobacter caeni TaxID=2705474 RepID=A0A6B2KSX2_9NEIS|nr:AMP-binding protein [Crenobacter caeni]NDV13204.1 long-chain fatty acid--CoA ligase [Crenobacter caeni]